MNGHNILGLVSDPLQFINLENFLTIIVSLPV